MLERDPLRSLLPNNVEWNSGFDPEDDFFMNHQISEGWVCTSAYQQFDGLQATPKCSQMQWCSVTVGDGVDCRPGSKKHC
eukprot:m.196349 g.196349  ORF g.196349 m.196349 type:complete len:80 (-) comp53745_c0_seq1:627-866(-)